ncbi:MAG: Pyrrolo-quinoline quinone [Verrucomicrobiales bacterium]|nr:Pyrrolo-quinoline quinone [Verrucomicrobiales bacterium]
MQLKLTCRCGTRFSFDVEPVNGLMPFTVACPTCGIDGTEAANQLLAQTGVAQKPQFTILSSTAATESAATAEPPAPYVPEVPASQKSKLRVAGAHAAAPTSPPTAAAAAATATGEMCNRHLDKPSAAHCTVCQKPICPECMSMFGYLCSVKCRYQAEQQGTRVPVYKFQKRSVEARQFRKGALITAGVVVIIFGLIAAWYWYDFSGSKPKLNYTLKVGSDRSVHSQFLDENQLLIVSSDRAYVHDIKTDKDVWSTDLKDAPRPKPQAPAADGQTPAAANPAQAKSAKQSARNVNAALGERYASATPTQTTKPAAKVVKPAATAPDDSEPADTSDEDSSFGFNSYSDYGRPRVFVDAENIWVCFNNRLKCLARKTGEVKNTIPIDGLLVQFTPTDSNILLVSAPTATHRLLTRIEIPAGTVTTNEVIVPRPAKKTLKGELPVNVLPTAGVLLHQELQDRELYRPQVIQTSSEFFASADNLVELRVRLVEPKRTSVDTMKKKGPTVINGQLSASSNTKAVAEEIFNDIKRSNTGGFKTIDESTYLVMLRRYAGKDAIDWTNNISGLPLFFAFISVDVIVAN